MNIWVALLIASTSFIERQLSVFRIIYLAKRNILMSTVVSFFLCLSALISLWYLFNDFNTINIIAYVSALVLGQYLGIIYASKVNIGKVTVQIILSKYDDGIVREITDLGHRVTTTKCKGYKNKGMILSVVTNENAICKLKSVIEKYADNAYVVINNDNEYIENQLSTFIHKMGRRGV